MKKLLLLCTLCLLLVAATLPVGAAAPATAAIATDYITRTVTVLENGDYMVETLYVYESAVQSRATTQTLHGAKDYEYFTEDGEAIFRFTLEALFEVELGVSATCVDSGYAYSIYDSAWKKDSASHWYQGNTAYATGVFKHKILFVTIFTVEFDLHLSCDAQGNFY